jgi:hypothetical protein
MPQPLYLGVMTTVMLEAIVVGITTNAPDFVIG